MQPIQTFEHNGRALQITADDLETASSAPALETTGMAPGTGNFEIGPLKLSADKIKVGETLTLSAQVSGKNIAYIYTEILLRDPGLAQFYGPVAQEFVLSGKNKEVEGVIYPVWEAVINLTLSISPSLRLLSDGVDTAFAFMRPTTYGQAAYQLDGLYTRQGAENPHRARLKFDSAGEITGMLVYKGSAGRSTPHALSINPGDQFSPFVKITTSSNEENPHWQSSRGFSTTLTWSDAGLLCLQEAPIPGDYLLGLVIQDMDGARSRQYTPFTLGG